jgi:hypothetical protein
MTSTSLRRCALPDDRAGGALARTPLRIHGKPSPAPNHMDAHPFLLLRLAQVAQGASPWTDSLGELLLKAAQQKRVNYIAEHHESELRKNEHDDEHHEVLKPGADDEVVITAPDDHSCDTTMRVKIWRNKVSAMKPVWGQEAPVVDLDDGECRYVLLEAKDVNGQATKFLRGYTNDSAGTFADVLEESVPPLALAGYTDLKCLGGGAHFSRHDAAHAHETPACPRTHTNPAESALLLVYLSTAASQVLRITMQLIRPSN